MYKTMIVIALFSSLAASTIILPHTHRYVRVLTIEQLEGVSGGTCYVCEQLDSSTCTHESCAVVDEGMGICGEDFMHDFGSGITRHGKKATDGTSGTTVVTLSNPQPCRYEACCSDKTPSGICFNCGDADVSIGPYNTECIIGGSNCGAG